MNQTSHEPRARQRLSRRHALAIALLVLAGVAGAALILRPQPAQPAAAVEAAAGHEKDGHEKDGHGDDDAKGAHGKDAKKAESPEHGGGEHGDKHGDEEPARVQLSDAQLAAAGVELQAAGPAGIASVLRLPGEIRLNEDRTAHIVPRAAGVVESVSASVGQQVRRGQVLAVLSSSAVSELRAELQSARRRRELARATYERETQLWEEKISARQDMLQARQAWQESDIAVANATHKLRALGAAPDSADLARIELRAPFDGVVVERHLTLGEAAREDTSAFTVADLGTVWAQVSVAAHELAQVRVGESATVRAGASQASAQGEISYVSALMGEQSRAATARVTLPNPAGAWRPGLFVNVEVITQQAQVPVAVLGSALQSQDGRSVVFVRQGEAFVAQAVQTGRSDERMTEIVQGLPAGAVYAAQGSFIVKSELGKGSAAHEH
ncbi:efflux RND transporter periplasmic adaptor subunit [Pulveribacter suum]|uniref:Efflux transporter periplasmic adaptor subunit n=1 Tax=Pulveribacter suum TaxID=2116657 RepID=A0A2P1NMJ8_9BURK|nr:efflux RND transporter periplasmic adaptor subunit [Pulveribacter suum]AVP58275.1 efflux transporter periplasmic adaptor subunit [Pulveribacter suum]